MATHSSIPAWKNPMDGGTWWATVHGVAKSRTQLRDFTFTFHFITSSNSLSFISVFYPLRLVGEIMYPSNKTHRHHHAPGTVGLHSVKLTGVNLFTLFNSFKVDPITISIPHRRKLQSAWCTELKHEAITLYVHPEHPRLSSLKHLTNETKKTDKL